MDDVLEPLARSPKLPQYLNELQILMKNEADARQRFRDWLDEDKKAEFINGEIILHSPAKYQHNNSRSYISRLLGLYVDVKQIGKVQDEKALISLSRNDYEPDISFWRQEIASAFDEEQMVFPPPDLVIEILSPSTEHKDRGVKFDDYATHGTMEYWIVDPVVQAIEQYILDNGSYLLHKKHVVGELIESNVVAGFKMPVKAAFDRSANVAASNALFA